MHVQGMGARASSAPWEGECFWDVSGSEGCFLSPTSTAPLFTTS